LHVSTAVQTRSVLAATGLALATVAATATTAHAQYDVRGYVSTRGLDFIAEQVPSLVPTSLAAPELSQGLACITATQRDTTVALSVDDFSLTIPQAGTLRLTIALSAEASGELFVDNAIACFGSLTCQDRITVNDARAVIDFDVALVGGQPSIDFRAVDLQLSADNIDIQLSECAVADVANVVIDFAKQFVIDFITEKAEELAVTELGPLVESMVAGVGTFSGSFPTPFGTYDIAASFDELLVQDGGIGLGASLDLSSQSPAAECVSEFDAGDPGVQEGAPPDLSASDSHIGLALNLGLAEDALYHVWRQGLTCITGDTLEALGIELPIEKITAIIPGFPPGSTLAVEARLTQPPRVKGAGQGEDGVAVTLAVDGVDVVMRGVLPDGTERVISVVADVEATAAVGVDLASNALVATPQQVTLSRVEMDQVSVAETGFDVARMTEVLRDHMMPKLLAEFGSLPVTGPVFKAGPLPFAVILRGMGNTDAYMSVNADLFRIPEGDEGAPETSIVGYPSAVVSPADALVQVSGVDGLIPTELLSYQVTVNGVARPPSYIKRISVAEPGVSGTYDVQIAALDLSGNVDGSPASVQVEVDGIAPELVLEGDQVRKMEGENAKSTVLTWRMSDDRTDSASLKPRIELYAVTDPEDLLAVEHVRTIEIAAGATTGTVEIEGGELYRAELFVTDAVGNESVSAVLLDASKDEGGCSAPGGAGGGLSLLIALIGALGLVPRRRR
jgi:hypothetical protein